MGPLTYLTGKFYNQTGPDQKNVNYKNPDMKIRTRLEAIIATARPKPTEAIDKRTGQ